MNPKAEQTMWVSFIDHLKTNEQLPVVAFTLSRNRYIPTYLPTKTRSLLRKGTLKQAVITAHFHLQM